MPVSIFSYAWYSLSTKQYAGMSERLKELVLKTSEVKASVGSNPTPGAIFYLNRAEGVNYEVHQIYG